MKIQFLKSVSNCLVLSAVLLATSCNEEQIMQESMAEGQEVGNNSNAKFSIPKKLDAFGLAEKIEDYMEQEKTSFGYSIFSGGNEVFVGMGGDGFARKSFESGGSHSHGASVKQETNQVTQYVTALAVFRTLRKNNLSLKTKVWPYLPKDWTPSDQFKNLNFEQLLAHKTGLKYDGTPQSIKISVKGNVNTSVRQPNDINYILLGIMTPYIDAVEMSKKGNATKLTQLNMSASNFPLYQSEFRKNVQENVFIPAGLKDASLIDWDAWNASGTIAAHLSTQGYPEKTGNAPGTDKPSTYAIGGATGLYMSASQFAQLQYAVSQLKVIPSSDIILMKSNLIGYDGALEGSLGKYYYKSGIGHNCETLIINFGSAQVAIFANTPQASFASTPSEIALLFEKSLVEL
ncbi:hypothetical protein [Dyadobacter sp. CY347]|uniref:hypothetical protein n=1 Tax=Dyadobacter sp. CY347 TaxID=2909336 RepID=UPI001F1707E5|nr:hypothetical protein [Dyadobacter sp. CY347]MCF2491470.1 hypothetical protein [Dyadobacter sp. CY347]